MTETKSEPEARKPIDILQAILDEQQKQLKAQKKFYKTLGGEVDLANDRIRTIESRLGWILAIIVFFIVLGGCSVIMPYI